jgi:N-acetylmuramoyl-L-alanine amidase
MRIMRWNRFWILGLGTLFTCTFFIQAKNNPVSRKQDKPIRTIVIDAGHGGEDPGAKGSYSTEKQVTLEVALKLGKLLEENMPDVKVVYTRKTDRYDDPRKKAQIANDNKGELFVSIHCNSTGKIRKVTGYKTVYHKKGKRKVATKQAIYAYFPSNAKGTETYIWATSKNSAKMESLKQNSVIVLDANSEETKQLMDDTDPETFILLNTLRNAYFDQSLRLSTLIEDDKEMKKEYGYYRQRLCQVYWWNWALSATRKKKITSTPTPDNRNLPTASIKQLNVTATNWIGLPTAATYNNLPIRPSLTAADHTPTLKQVSHRKASL